MNKRIFTSISSLLFLAIILLAPATAFAQFDADFGKSHDSGNFGYEDLGKWFFNNGFAASQSAGETFAQNGYIGHGAADSDPYFFNAGHYTFSLAQQIAQNADLAKFGVYTGTGLGKSLTEVLGAGETGPKGQNISNAFGLYLNTPTEYRNNTTTNWFTDRSENASNQTGGSPLNSGGDPQALIYKLSGQEWLVAWEDLDFSNTTTGHSDHDFNDAYLKITATPEPVSMALFGLGSTVLAAGGLRKRRKK